MTLDEKNKEWITYLDQMGHETQAHYSEHERDGFPELFKEAFNLENSLLTEEQCPMLIIKSEILQVDIHQLAIAVIVAGKSYSKLSSLIGSYRALGAATLQQLKDKPELWDNALESLKRRMEQDIIKYEIFKKD